MLRLRAVLFGLIVLTTASSKEEQLCCLSEAPRVSSIDVRHLEYQGIGFDQGYTSFDFFLSNDGVNSIFFLDGRAHVFNDGRPAANAGVGWRQISDCHAYGINAYYDYRKTHHMHFNQVGCGLEFFTPFWEFRANGYFPVGAKKCDLFDVRFAHFAGHEMFISRKYQFAMTGGDAELGWHFKHWDQFDLFAGVGPYYFQGDIGKAAIGGKARIQARVTPYLTLEAADSYDAVFHNRFHAEVTVSLPLGPRVRPCNRCCCTDDEMALQQWLHTAPKRQEIVVASTQRKTTAAIDPSTGLPFFFLFVDNTSSSNGTFESPYPTLTAVSAAMQPGNIIYVFPGNGTSSGLNTGIVLLDNQRFLGSGVSHNFVTTLGPVTIPQQTPTNPTIANTNIAPIVTLAYNNEVSGFVIMDGIGASTISGAWNSGTTSVNINRNQILNGLGIGIRLIPTNTTIDMAIENNTFFNQPGTEFFAGTGFAAIDCGFQAGSTGTVLIQNNSIEFARGYAVHMDNLNALSITTQILNNFITNAGDESILIDVDGSSTVAETIIEGNTIYGMITPSAATPGLGQIHLITEGSAIHASLVLNNNIDQSQSAIEGIVIESANGATANAQTISAISGNSVRGGTKNIRLSTDTLSAGTFRATLTNNYLTHAQAAQGGSPSEAFLFLSQGTGDTAIQIKNNLLDFPSGGSGFLMSAPGPAVCNVNLDIEGNTLSDIPTGNGINLQAPNANNAKVNIVNNTINRSFSGITGDIAAGNWVIHCNGNRTSSIDNGPISFTNSGTDPLCVRINDNITESAILLGGPMNLELPVNNTSGYSLLTLPIVIIPAGSCE